MNELLSKGSNRLLFRENPGQIILPEVAAFEKILNLKPPSGKFEGRGIFYQVFH